MTRGRSLFFIGACSLILSGCDMVDFFADEETQKLTEISLILEDKKKDSYLSTDVFSEFIDKGGLVVSVELSNGSTRVIGRSEYTLSVSSFEGANIDDSKAFGKSGNYVVEVKHNLLINSYTISVK